MIAVPESNGDELPKSRTNPVSFDVLLNVTVVPTFTQNGALSLASGILALAEAKEPPTRVMLTSQADVAEPHLPTLQTLPEEPAAHTSFLTFFLSQPLT
jgi:hypothetical protein